MQQPDPTTSDDPNKDTPAADLESSTDTDTDTSTSTSTSTSTEAEARSSTDKEAETGAETEAASDEHIETDEEPDEEPDEATEMDRSRLRAADPGRRNRTDAMPAGTVFMVMVGVLSLAAAFNAETMLHRAETSEFGFRRDVALAFWRPVAEVTAPFGFGVPRSGVEAIRGADGPNGEVGGSLAAADATSATANAEPGRLGHEPAGPSIDLETTAATEAAPPATAAETTSTATPLGLPPAPPTLAENQATNDSTTPGAGPAAESTSGDVAIAPDPPSPQLRQPTAEDPLRILIIGDSTMDAVGNSMLRDLTGTGVASGQLDFRISTGLSRPDFFDWPAHLRELRGAQATEVVVLMIGANDAQPFLIEEVPENYGTERWFATYRQRVAALLDELTAGGSWVIWIGQPVMRNQEFDVKMQQLNQIYIDEISRYPSATYVDSRTIMSDEGGAFSAYLPDPGGNLVLVRQTDGVHLTTAGGDRLSPLVIDLINSIAPLY